LYTIDDLHASELLGLDVVI